MSLFDAIQDAVKVFFEAHVEHLVRFIKHDCFEFGEVFQASLIHVIHNSSGRADEDVNTIPYASLLLQERDTTVHGQNIVLVGIVLQTIKGPCDLHCKFSCGSKNDSLSFACVEQLIRPEIFNYRKSKSKGFARTSQISHNHVLSIVDIVESLVLHWEQILNSILL